MGYEVAFETTSAADLTQHVDAFVGKNIKDPRQQAQIAAAIPLVADAVKAIGLTEGGSKYAVKISGHAGAKPGRGDAIHVSVTRGEDLPKKAPAPDAEAS